MARAQGWHCQLLAQHMQRAPIAYILAHMAHSTSPSCSSVDNSAPNARYGPRKPLFSARPFWHAVRTHAAPVPIQFCCNS